MKIVTTYILPDEPAYGLFEGPESGRWLQKVFVVRGDAIAQYRTDFGPAKSFKKVTPLVMPSDGEDTVAQLQHYAEKNRHDFHWYNRSQEMLAESTLVQDHLDLLERQVKTALNRSEFGPGASIQRNGFRRSNGN